MKEIFLKDFKLKVSKGNAAFIFGNGINCYKDERAGERSWEKLLLALYKKHSGNELKTIPPGISYTEFFDLLLLHSKSGKVKKSALVSDFMSGVRSWKPAPHHQQIVSHLEKHNCAVLTTNFDLLLAQSVSAQKKFTLKSRKKAFSAHYPWQCYYANKELNENAEGFAIWFLHGMCDYASSIKLGLNDYAGNIMKARELFPFMKRDELYFPGKNTWMHVFLNKPLFVLGFGLDEQEVFMRWLLVKRAAFNKANARLKNSGWFLCRKIDDGKRFFLESCGFRILECDYDFMYEGMW